MGIIRVNDVNGVQYDIPDGSRVALQGLDIIGDGVVDWNEPTQRNLVTLSNQIIMNKNESTTALALKADSASVYTKAETEAKITELSQSVDVNHNHDSVYLKDSDFASANLSALIQ